MHDQPKPTPEEEEQAPTERQHDEESMRQAGHGDPPDVETSEPQDDSEIHDA
jgi:hypothetical protein